MEQNRIVAPLIANMNQCSVAVWQHFDFKL